MQFHLIVKLIPFEIMSEKVMWIALADFEKERFD